MVHKNSGEEVFGVFVDSIFKMKCNGVVGAKQVINVLWGYLCSRSVKEIQTWKTDTPVVEDMGLMHKMEPRFKDNGKQGVFHEEVQYTWHEE